ncbi:MAG: hypothetical protein NT011_08580 [Kiritimatiellaeota bacterium]|nr:hypothetical protein [Kiritimatiellota bacterium]
MHIRLYILSVIITWAAFPATLAASPPVAEVNHYTITGRVALVSSLGSENVNKLLDMATIQLAACGCELVERQEIERILQEQKLALQGVIDPSQAIALGTILRADIFAFFEYDPANKLIYNLVVFDSATGARLVDISLPEDFNQKLQLTVKSISEAQQKRVSLKYKEQISTVCFLPEHNVDLPPNQSVFCRTVNRLLERYLIQSPEIIVLERQQLDRINRENMLTPCQATAQLLGSAITVASDFQKDGTNDIAANVLLCNVKGTIITNLTASADAVHPEKLAQILGLKIIEILGKRAPQSVMDQRLEGICFGKESDYLFAKNQFTEALAAANAAYALCPSRDFAIKRALCQMVLAQELFTHDSMASNDAQYQEGLALAKEAILTRIDSLESANITNSTAFVAHLMIEWQGFHERLYNLWRPRGSVLMLPAGKLFLGNHEYPRPTPETKELFLMSRQYVDAVIDRWAAMAPTDAFAMNTLSWYLSEPQFCNRIKDLLLLFYPDQKEYLRRQESLGLKWLAALKIRGFDRGPLTPLPGTELDGPYLVGVGDKMQFINTCASTIGNSVLWELITLPHTNQSLYSAMQQHPESIVRVYAKIGQLHKEVNLAKMPNESTTRQFVDIRQFIQRLIVEDNEDELGRQRRKRACYAWFDLIRATSENHRDAYYIELWQFMLGQNDVIEDIFYRFDFPKESLSKFGSRLYDLCIRTIDFYNQQNMVPPSFLQSQLTQFMPFATNRVTDVKLWNDETALLDLDGKGSLTCPVILGKDLIVLVDQKNERFLQIMRIPLTGGAPQIVGSMPRNWQIKIISSACANAHYYCIGTHDNGIVIIPLDGSPPWRLTEETGLPARLVNAIGILDNVLYIGLNNSVSISDAAGDNSSFLMTCDLNNRQVKTIATNRSRQSQTPLDKTSRFDVHYIIPDSNRGRIVFMVEAYHGLEISRRFSGLWQVDIKTQVMKKIPGPWSQTSWAQPIDDEHFRMITRDWSLEYDLRTDTARVARVTGSKFGVGDPARANSKEGVFVQYPIDPEDLKLGVVKEDGSTVHTSRITQWACPEIMIRGSVWFVKPFSRVTSDGKLEFLAPIRTSTGRSFDDFTLLHAFDDGQKLAVANSAGIWILNLNPEATENILIETKNTESSKVRYHQGDATRPQTSMSLSDLAGSYTSIIFSGIQSCSGKTVLYQDGAVLTGSYEFKDPDGLVEGKLTEFRLLNGRTVVCKWQDQFGTGTLSMEFSADLKSFDGSWSSSESQSGFTWNGKR